jgi:hypothetical protein
MPRLRRRWLRWLIGLGVLLCLPFVGCWLASSPPPEGEEGALAEALAARVEAALDIPAWRKIPAVGFTRGERRHLWDRSRGLDRLTYGEGAEAVEVLLDLGTRRGVALRGGRRVGGEEAAELLEDAYKRWVGDSFWLNPLAKLREPGVSRRASPEVPDSLVVHFSSGGLTPGDTYRFHLGPDGKPDFFELWVSVIPLKGLKASFEGWRRLPGGAWVAEHHDFLPGFPVDITGVAEGESAAALNGGRDPFAPLLTAPE